ncbi:gliding motility-associated lipoprotein GldH [Pedobacter sp. UYP24]
MNNLKVALSLSAVMILFFCGCDTNTIVDSNVAMPSRNWSYANRISAVVEVKDAAKMFNIYLKLRHTADYRYSNLFVLLHIEGAGEKKQTKRYEYRLALQDGQWIGAGSGNLFTYTLPLLTNYKFPKAGKYRFEVEQNMRDNPLREVSDAGIKISQQGQ